MASKGGVGTTIDTIEPVAAQRGGHGAISRCVGLRVPGAHALRRRSAQRRCGCIAVARSGEVGERCGDRQSSPTSGPRWGVLRDGERSANMPVRALVETAALLPVTAKPEQRYTHRRPRVLPAETRRRRTLLACSRGPKPRLPPSLFEASTTSDSRLAHDPPPRAGGCRVLALPAGQRSRVSIRLLKRPARRSRHPPGPIGRRARVVRRQPRLRRRRALGTHQQTSTSEPREAAHRIGQLTESVAGLGRHAGR